MIETITILTTGIVTAIAIASVTLNFTQREALKSIPSLNMEVHRLDNRQQVIFTRIENIDKNIEEIKDSVKELRK